MSPRKKSNQRDTSPSQRKLRELIELGETDTVEFKRRFSDFDKIAKEIIAFANTLSFGV